MRESYNSSGMGGRETNANDISSIRQSSENHTTIQIEDQKQQQVKYASYREHEDECATIIEESQKQRSLTERNKR
jgi:hypothetical protein